ncbi:deuterolysin metalloprotease [Pleomassaria siparia CBS 279.74]|uniref:Neutral protease 2 n=1 Tax=Pleomassaria siparia CBS 279.74 TaxID=1314801 RepID=A0A6G1KIC6_9PLEO|nr:deuterolysin metalloprotease [Pleomassaria siparia CBS 279.74]
MKLISLATLTKLASALSIDLAKRESPLNVTIEMIGNTAVKAYITNVGSTDLKIFKTGTFLNDAPVEKLKVFQGESQVAFEGIYLSILATSMEEEAFQTIVAGETVEKEFDIAAMHDVSVGGSFDVVSSGTLSIAEASSTELTGTVPFSSNVLTVAIDGAEAQKTRRTIHEKRTIVQSGCTGTQRTATVNAIANARTLSRAGGGAANSNTAKMTEYFHTTTSANIAVVVGVFSKVISEATSTTSGVSKTYCTDIYPACSSGVLAYTSPAESYIVNCPLYFTALPALTTTCHAQDQATTTLHEMTHLSQIKGTEDYSTYGYAASVALSTDRALNHADSYALFANAIYIGC